MQQERVSETATQGNTTAGPAFSPLDLRQDDGTPLGYKKHLGDIFSTPTQHPVRKPGFKGPL